MSQYTDSLKKKAREYGSELAALKERMAKDQARAVDLTGAIAGIETLLRVEGEGLNIAAEPQVPSAPATTSNGTSFKTPELYDVLKETLLSDSKERSTVELIQLAKSRGVDFGEKEPYRTVSFTLMGIARGKKIERVNGDRWRRIG